MHSEPAVTLLFFGFIRKLNLFLEVQRYPDLIFKSRHSNLWNPNRELPQWMSPSWESNTCTDGQKIPQGLGDRKFITILTKDRHLSLFWARWFLPVSDSNSWTSTLILHSYLCQGLTNGLLPSVSPPKLCMHLCSPQYVPHTPPIPFFPISSPE